MFSQMKWAYIWFKLVRAYLEGIAIFVNKAHDCKSN